MRRVHSPRGVSRAVVAATLLTLAAGGTAGCAKDHHGAPDAPSATSTAPAGEGAGLPEMQKKLDAAQSAAAAAERDAADGADR